LWLLLLQTTPLLAGLAVGAAAYAARTALVSFQSFKAAGPRLRQFYKGGFLPEMTRREASLILGAWFTYSTGNVLFIHNDT
jgi:DnaJ family protein C protein 19